MTQNSYLHSNFAKIVVDPEYIVILRFVNLGSTVTVFGVIRFVQGG